MSWGYMSGRGGGYVLEPISPSIILGVFQRSHFMYIYFMFFSSSLDGTLTFVSYIQGWCAQGRRMLQ